MDIQEILSSVDERNV